MTISDYLKHNYIIDLHREKICVSIKSYEEFLVIRSLLMSFNILDSTNCSLPILEALTYPRCVVLKFMRMEKIFKYQYTVRTYYNVGNYGNNVLEHNFHEFIMSAWLISKNLI